MSRLLFFRNPIFGYFWAARMISYLGSASTFVVLPLYVYEVGDGDPTLVGVLALAVTLPRLLGPVAGTVADRMDGRRLMILCNLGEAALIGSVALFLPPFPVLVVLVAGSSAISTLFFPAGRSAVPMIVGREDLTSANALVGTAANLSFAVGPALGAFAFAWVGARGALALDAATFLISAALLLRLPALPPTPNAETTRIGGFFGEVRDGVLYVMRQPRVRALTIGLLLSLVFITVDIVALVFLARESLDTGAAGYGVLAAAHGIGMILGPLLLVRRARRVLVPVIFLGLALEGGTLLLTGLAPTLLLAVVLRIIGGVGNGVENVAVDTVLQTEVERPMLGRVFGIVYGGAMLAEGLGTGLGTLLLEFTSPRATFIIAGCASLAVVPLVWRLLPRREASKPPAPG